MQAARAKWLSAVFTLAAFALFPAPIATLRGLLAVFDHAHAVNLGHALVPGAGETALPARVLDMRALLRAHGARAFSCTPTLCDSENLQQRVAEGIYPIEQKTGAAELLAAATEPPPRGCALVERKNDVALYRCD